MPSVNLHTREERQILGEALNLLRKKYAEIEEQGGQQVRNARRRQAIADDLDERLPSLNAFPSENVDDESEPDLVFFADCGTSFKQVTKRSFLGTRKAGDIRVARRFRVNLESSRLTVKESYYFGEYHARDYERGLGRVQDIKRHTENPLWFAKKDGQRIEDYCYTVHLQCVERDDQNVSRILADDPALRPHIWRMYRRDRDWDRDVDTETDHAEVSN